MAISKKMNLRLEKIEALINQGYVLKSSFVKDFYHQLIDKEGKKINTFQFSPFRSKKIKGNSLPGISWIAYFLGAFCAVKIKHWGYFWITGILFFISALIDLAITNALRIDINLSNLIGLIFNYIYAINFPYQRWLFSKSNKRELGNLKSYLFSILLLFLALLPSILINAIPNNIEKGQNISTSNISNLDLPNNVSVDSIRGDDLQNDPKLDNSESSTYIYKVKQAGDYFSKGVIEYEKGNYEKAIKEFNNSIDVLPLNESFYNRALAKDSLGQFEGAIEDFTNAIAKKPDDFASYTDRGLVKNKIGDFEGALKDYNNALSINPKYSIAIHNRGITKGQGLGDEKGACEDFQEAINLGNEITLNFFKNNNNSICPNIFKKDQINQESYLSTREDPYKFPNYNVDCPNFIKVEGKEKICLK